MSVPKFPDLHFPNTFKNLKDGKDWIIQHVQDLMKDGGGVISIDTVTDKGLGDVENSLRDLLEPEPFQNLIQWKRLDGKLYFFVKSWCSADGRPKFLTKDTDLELRPGTSKMPGPNLPDAKEQRVIMDPTEELMSRFETVLSIKDSPPCSKPVYSTERISELLDRIFPVQEGETVIKKLKELKNNIEPDLVKLTGSNSKTGYFIMSSSLAVDIDMKSNSKVQCEALLITTETFPTLFFWVEEETDELWEFAYDVAFKLKQKLVNPGGYTEWLCVIPKLVDRNTGRVIKHKPPPYPDVYKLGSVTDVKALLKSLTIVLMSFTSAVRDRSEFFNLLTEEQFQILNNHEETKHLFIHGSPGTGKTVLALEKIRRIKNSTGCRNEEILFLCENLGLKHFVESQSVCSCMTRAKFVKTETEETSNVKHVIVDEAQNFEQKNSLWYMKAKSLSLDRGGYFWLFVDITQKTHIFPDCLPPLSDQRKVYLTKNVRNSIKVSDAMSHRIENIIDHLDPVKQDHINIQNENYRPNHSFMGDFEEITVPSPERWVINKITELLAEGISVTEIAVLYSTMKKLNEKKSVLGEENRNQIQFYKVEKSRSGVVLDSIRRFSGLERDIVIVVDPYVHEDHENILFSVELVAYSRARTRLYVIKSEAPQNE